MRANMAHHLRPGSTPRTDNGGRGNDCRLFEAEIDENPASLIDKAEQSLYEIAEKGRIVGLYALEELAAGAIEMAERAYQREGHLSGISTGFRGLDDMLGGFQESDLIILAGRPGMGKTALATNVAFNCQ